MLANDFGSVNVDAELVVGAESDIVSLANAVSVALYATT